MIVFLWLVHLSCHLFLSGCPKAFAEELSSLLRRLRCCWEGLGSKSAIYGMVIIGDIVVTGIMEVAADVS